MKRFGLAFLMALIVLPATVHAQPIDWAKAEADARDSARTDTGATIPAPVNAKVQAASDDYYIASLHHRAAVFEWQAFASKIIFWMVITLVASGILFSAFQFYHSMRTDKATATEEIELSLKNIKVKSQFLGVVTLAISLAFFYLYVSNIYPIVPVGVAHASLGKK